MGTDLTCIAVDDEPRALEVIERHASKVHFLTFQNGFRDPIKALEWLDLNHCQILFLDINMPKISGIEMKKNLDPKILTVFTTAYSEYAVDSYELEAFDYLVKPVTFERFLKTTMRAKRHLENNLPKISTQSGLETHNDFHCIYIKSGNQLHRIHPSDIFFLEKDGNYIWIHAADKKILSRFSMKQIIEMLPSEEFIQTHRSYIVGIRHIDIVANDKLVVKWHEIPISRSFKPNIFDKLGI